MKVWLWFWFACSLLFFGEESSWLQHYILYETPDFVSEINTQGEFNIHNLEIFQSKTLLANGLTMSNLLSAQHLFQLGFFTYFMIFPLILRFSPASEISQRLQIPVPGRNLILTIWPPILFTIVLSIASLDDPVTKRAMAEVREMFYSLGIGVFAVSALISLKMEPKASRAS